jgi:hypothetical protein
MRLITISLIIFCAYSCNTQTEIPDNVNAYVKKNSSHFQNEISIPISEFVNLKGNVKKLTQLSEMNFGTNSGSEQNFTVYFDTDSLVKEFWYLNQSKPQKKIYFKNFLLGKIDSIITSLDLKAKSIKKYIYNNQEINIGFSLSNDSTIYYDTLNSDNLFIVKNGNTEKVYSKNTLISEKNKFGKFTYEYYPSGRLKKIDRYYGKIINKETELNKREQILKEVIHNSQKTTVISEYDNLGNLKRVRTLLRGDTNLVLAESAYKNDLLTFNKLQGGQTTQKREYDKLGNLTLIKNEFDNNTVEKVFEYFDFDSFGNWTVRKRVHNGKVIVTSKRILEYYK